MRHELDHIFVATSAGGRSADVLVELGFSEGTANVHPGQGTANRRFFFHNAMLEVLWISDANEAQSEITRPTRLWERCQTQSNLTCPFGLCLRPSSGSNAKAPFPVWPYRPQYLPSPHTIDIATNSDVLTEPMLFYLSFGSRPDAAAPPKRQSIEHSAGVREVTRVHWIRPAGDPLSPELGALVDAGHLSIDQGESQLLELGFDGEARGRSADLRSFLPLVLRW
jgi:Glyoxalase-like domain